MIISVSVNNFLVFSNKIEFSLKADMHIKRFPENVFSYEKTNVVKSACIYGTNNSGKTCLIEAISTIRDIMLGRDVRISTNFFSKSKVCEFGITFMEEEKIYQYIVKYDSDVINHDNRGFFFESLKEITYDQYNNEKKTTIFIKDGDKGEYYFLGDEDLSEMMHMVSRQHIVLRMIKPECHELVAKYVRIFDNFARKIVILDMNDIPIENTISVIRDESEIKDDVVNLIKSSDIGIDDIRYIGWDEAEIDSKDILQPRERILNRIPYNNVYLFVGLHQGKEIPLLASDSKGTMEIIALASYIVDALRNNKILVVDELDNSLHFSITRALLGLFNSDMNMGTQLIFTAQDVSLLDTERLMRKDQITFISKDISSAQQLYRLDSYTSREDGLRSESNVYERYRSGYFGAMSHPDYFDVSLNIAEEKLHEKDSLK